MQRILLASCVLFSLAWINSCSVPNLESATCVAARDTVKRFYSIHFANEIQPSRENPQENSSLLTSRLIAELAAAPDGNDYFTQTGDFPKAFRVGSCDAATTDEATFQVVLLWRDDSRNDQSEVKVTTVRSGENWLIDRVAK